MHEFLVLISGPWPCGILQELLVQLLDVSVGVLQMSTVNSTVRPWTAMQ